IDEKTAKTDEAQKQRQRERPELRPSKLMAAIFCFPSPVARRPAHRRGLTGPRAWRGVAWPGPPDMRPSLNRPVPGRQASSHLSCARTGGRDGETDAERHAEKRRTSRYDKHHIRMLAHIGPCD